MKEEAKLEKWVYRIAFTIIILGGLYFWGQLIVAGVKCGL
jgi:hypothetical protein